VIAISAAVGVGQNLTLIPMLPTYFGWAGDYYCVILGITALVTLPTGIRRTRTRP
jgi:hypothetical protein